MQIDLCFGQYDVHTVILLKSFFTDLVVLDLQPAPPVNDSSPFNVFRPREKLQRPHSRRSVSTCDLFSGGYFCSL